MTQNRRKASARGKKPQKDEGTPKKGKKRGPPQGGGHVVPDNWEEVFFETLGLTANVRGACHAAKIGKTLVYGRRSEDAEFAAKWQDALDDARDVIDQEIRRRGVHGWLEPVFQKGEQVGVVRKYSDTLLIFFAKGLNPAKYREGTDVRVSGSIGTGAPRPEPEHADPTPTNVQAIVSILGKTGALDREADNG